MTNEFEQKIEAAGRMLRQLTLASHDKDRIRENLSAYTLAHPLVQAPSHAVPSPFMLWLSPSVRNHLTPALVVALFLFGSGVSFAAEQALPGDALYTVKVNVNEEARALVTLSPQSKANWEAERLERRLSEATKLAASGKLDAKAEANIEANVDAHTEKLATHVEKLEIKNDFEEAVAVASKVEASLRAHGTILETIALGDRAAAEADTMVAVKAPSAAVSSDTAATMMMVVEGPADRAAKPSSGTLIAKVRAKTDEAAIRRAEAETILSSNDAPTEAAVYAKLKVVLGKIAEAKGYVGKTDGAPSETVVLAKAKLESAEEAYNQGAAKLEAGAYAEAFVTFQAAQGFAQEAKTLLKSKKEIENELKKEGTTTPVGLIEASPSGTKTDFPLSEGSSLSTTSTGILTVSGTSTLSASSSQSASTVPSNAAKTNFKIHIGF
jgi:hypothetical protein